MIDDLLRRHDGVITLAQAEGAGLSRHAVNRRVRSGRWSRCSRGVYFVEDRPFTDEARIRAAVWGHGPEAVASGLAAAWWHGITKYAPPQVEVTVPREARRVKQSAIRTRRRDLGPADVVEVKGLRVTEVALTIVEAAARRGGGVAVLDAALQRHRVDLEMLWQAHVRTKGRHGSPRARRLLQAAGDGAHSYAERLLIKLIESADITGWKANQPLAGYEIDVLFVDAKLVVEADGLAAHSNPEQFRKDRIRQNHLVLLGWQVLRFTWIDLTEYPERVIAEIRRAICGN